MARLNSGRKMQFLTGSLSCLIYTFRRHPFGVPVDNSVEEACTVIAPGQKPTPTTFDVNDYQCAHDHSHEVALRKIAEQQGVTLTGKLRGCK